MLKALLLIAALLINSSCALLVAGWLESDSRDRAAAARKERARVELCEARCAKSLSDKKDIRVCAARCAVNNTQ